MAYYVAAYVHGADGWAPALCADSSFLALAGPVGDRHLALLKSDDLLEGDRVREVSAHAAAAIEAAREYPPALAAARDAVDAAATSLSDGESIVAAYISAATEALAARDSDGWELVESVRDELGYLRCGESYWVRPVPGRDGRVSWVSDDYCVYRNPASDFNLASGQA